MTKDEISKIKEHIEIHAKRESHAIRITEIMWKAVEELEHIAELEKENAELKKRNKAVETTLELNSKFMKSKLTEAKEIIKDYMIIVKGGHITVCSVPEKNCCINVLKLNEQAEHFLNEVEIYKGEEKKC